MLAASADVFACPFAGKTLADLAEKKDAACFRLVKEAMSTEGAGRRLLEAAEKGRTDAVRRMLVDGGVEYDDGTPATETQMAKDVTTFLAWAAEPEADDRKLMGAKFMFALSLVAVQAVYYKRWMWSPLKARRLVVNAVH